MMCGRGAIASCTSYGCSNRHGQTRARLEKNLRELIGCLCRSTESWFAFRIRLVAFCYTQRRIGLIGQSHRSDLSWPGPNFPPVKIKSWVADVVIDQPV